MRTAYHVIGLLTILVFIPMCIGYFLMPYTKPGHPEAWAMLWRYIKGLKVTMVMVVCFAVIMYLYHVIKQN